MIYLLEDNDDIRELVVYSLEKTGNRAQGFALPSEFYEALGKRLPKLVILDIMLPEESGLDVLKKLRARRDTRDIPIIMLTAKGTEFDKVSALDEGADDYITKPFGVMELVARIKAVLRRSGSTENSADEVYCAGGLVLYVEKHKVLAGDCEIQLTHKEFELLTYLFENRGKVLGRDAILNDIWGYSFDGENRTVDVHIRTLRQKLGDYGSVIETVRGVGYRIEE